MDKKKKKKLTRSEELILLKQRQVVGLARVLSRQDLQRLFRPALQIHVHRLAKLRLVSSELVGVRVHHDGIIISQVFEQLAQLIVYRPQAVSQLSSAQRSQLKTSWPANRRTVIPQDVVPSLILTNPRRSRRQMLQLKPLHAHILFLPRTRVMNVPLQRLA